MGTFQGCMGIGKSNAMHLLLKGLLTANKTFQMRYNINFFFSQRTSQLSEVEDFDFQIY